MDSLRSAMNSAWDPTDRCKQLQAAEDITIDGGLQDLAISAVETHLSLESLSKESVTDLLTGLYNRNPVNNHLLEAVDRIDRHNTKFDENLGIALIYIDLDGFKPINDTYGHKAGDHVLVTVADRMVGSVRKSDKVHRHGGDEFIVIVTDLDSEEDATTRAKEIEEEVSKAILLESGDFLSVGCSSGISFINSQDISDINNMSRENDKKEEIAARIHEADISMYESKRRRKTYKFFFEE